MFNQRPSQDLKDTKSANTSLLLKLEGGGQSSIFNCCLLPFFKGDLPTAAAIMRLNKPNESSRLVKEKILLEKILKNAKELIEHVVRGEKDKVEAILKKDPYLLLYRAEVEDYSGRRIEATAYQAALGAEDVSRPNHPDEGMAEMIESYLRKLPNGEKNYKRSNC